MADIAIFRINYKSDFILTLQSDAGWMTPFCIKFWTGAPSRAYFVGFDGTTYNHCAVDGEDPTKLSVQFDDHDLPIGDLKFQIGYHFTVADFPTSVEDEVINQEAVIIDQDGTPMQVMLDFNGETAPEIQFSLPAYANEAQRIANEQQRIANETQRIEHEEQRIAAEEVRQRNESQRIHNEEQRVAEFARLRRESIEATNDANAAAELAETKANLAANKAALAQTAATLANQKARLADDKAALAAAAAANANEKAALAQAKAEYAQTKGDYAKTQGDYAKTHGDYAKAQGKAAHDTNVQVQEAEQTRQQQETTRQEQESARQHAEQQRATRFEQQMQAQQTAYEQAETARNTAYQEAETARTEAFEQAEEARDELVEEKVADITALQQVTATHTEQITQLQEIVADLETLAEGYVRVAGSSSPALSYKSYKYNEQGGFGRESAFSLFYPCLIGTKLTGGDAQVGKILHILQKLDYGHDIYGNARKIDGSEGDVLIVNIEPYYRIMGKHTINGTEYDVFLMSRLPFTWQGIESERMERFGWSPDYAVSHTDEDGVVRMHSVYNPEWNGSYTAPYGVAGKFIFSQDAETGEITETYDENTTLLGGSGGLHTTDLALYTGEQRAMNNNPDTTKMVPFANQTAAGAENMMALMLAEGGTFDAHNATLMGSGFSANDAATEDDYAESASGAKNGVRIMDKDGNWRYHSLAGNVNYLTGSSSTIYAGTLVNSYRNPWHIMEAHRAVSHAIQNGVHELEWFVFGGNQYKWRSINGFTGPAQGEMTCVVWKYMATKAGANAVDPSDRTTSIAGNRVEVLVSTALLHGMTTQVSPAWNTTGMIMSEYDDGRYECYMERDQERLIISENGGIPATDNYQYELLYKHVVTVNNGSGYARNYSNDALMLPNTNANKSGGGLHTYIGKYNYFSGTAASSGNKVVRAFRRGAYAYAPNLSPLYVNAYNAPSYTYASFAFGTCCRISES